MRERVIIVIALLVLLLGTACSRVDRSERPQGNASGQPTPAAKSLPLGSAVGEISSGGQTRHYRLHVPPGYRQGQATPLVLNLPGRRENAAQQERLSGMSDKADEAGFIVAYPEALGDPSTWLVGPGPSGDEDRVFLRDLIQNLEASLSIDPDRIYATGISNGGGMVDRLGCELSDTIAAIAPVSGAYLFSADCRPTRPVPVVAFHGTADRVVPYEGVGRSLPPIRDWAAAWAVRNGCGPSPREIYRRGGVVGEIWEGCLADASVTLYTIDGGGHAWPGAKLTAPLSPASASVDATDVIWQFFAPHKLSR